MKRNLTIPYLIERCTKTARKHGWKIIWEKNRFVQNQDLTTLEALALIHSELSEALEEYRDNNKESFGKEIAGCLIRLFHLVGDLGIDIESHLMAEMERNDARSHKHGRKIL